MGRIVRRSRELFRNAQERGLVDAQADAIMRLGWEFNLDNSRWRAEAASIEVSYLTELHQSTGDPVIATGAANAAYTWAGAATSNITLFQQLTPQRLMGRVVSSRRVSTMRRTGSIMSKSKPSSKPSSCGW